MIRIGVLAAVMAVLVFAVGESAAATLQAPRLMSPGFASPVTIHWTPVQAGAAANDGGSGKARGHDKDKPKGEGDKHGDKAHAGEGDGDGVWIQSVIRAPGACGAPAGNASVIASFADATTSDFSDPVADGTYCYWIEVTGAATVTASEGLTVVVAAGANSAAAGLAAGTSSGAVPVDTVPPPGPGKLRFSFPKSTATRVPVTVRWRNPAAGDLDRLELLMNRKHAPRGPGDGRVVYRGLAQTFELSMRAGQTAHLALYAIDHSGNVSTASRTLVSLATLIPMRPLSGSSIHAVPLLTWQATKGAAYYNLQIFNRGKRVLLAWPTRASFRLPAKRLKPGTYVWFVWPATGTPDAALRFGHLIGRATFVYVR